ncbi:hypothetical protein PgNI_05221 [Pyricularia grisea]|uniref:Uncharacterized protein n=1 Tax=Pyricularia grisea TaxID=148305 RepID=A0A6P8B407_PYRGI|nr:hypothetical protein PgNI_05221 [Pyricularia grisea]TLD09869.1 hypothetical protein PgNI_05221 [Pyricularia grisea]
MTRPSENKRPQPAIYVLRTHTMLRCQSIPAYNGVLPLITWSLPTLVRDNCLVQLQ